MLKPTKYDRVVKREVCRISNRGTKVCSFIDGETSEAQNNFLLALCEKDNAETSVCSYGVCFVDCSIGKFHVSIVHY